MSWCSVAQCHNTNKKCPDKSFFAIPKDKDRKAAWKAALNRTTYPKTIFVCSDHFEEKCFDASWKLQTELYYKDRPIKHKLVKGSVPSIFSYKEQPKYTPFNLWTTF